MTSDVVLAVNAGSSTLKYALYPVHDGLAEAPIFSGQAEVNGEAAFEAALATLRDQIDPHLPAGSALAAVAHRIVHGGDRFSASVLLDDAIVDQLATLNPLAPLHQPHNLRGVRAFRQAFPGLPQIGCFDTGFHATLPDVERRLPIPQALDAEGVRRYGFHGLSYRYLVESLGARLGTGVPQGRWLMAHLGSGASLSAVRDGQSVATTMGFSALDGLMMGTRSGSLDAGVLLHLLRQGWSAERIEKMLYKDCGLAGVSGLSNDMRVLRSRAADHEGAALAIRLFTRRVVREAGALVACLGGLDGMVFTGGIGEHDVQLRADVSAALAHLGVHIDPAANAAATGSEIRPIHPLDPNGANSDQGRVQVWVVPTDEGRIAARDASGLLATLRADSTSTCR